MSQKAQRRGPPRKRPFSGGPSAFRNARGFQVSGGNFTLAGGDVVHVTNVQNSYHHPNDGADRILDRLPSLNFRTIQMNNYTKRAPGTGEWFLSSKEFEWWTNGNAGKILWGTGIPGAGKTILTSLVINHLEQLAEGSRDISVAFVYFRYSETTTLLDVLLAIVRQQLERSPWLAEILGPFLARHQREHTVPSEEQLLHLLQEISQRFRVTFYVLDGLDEAPAHFQYIIVKSLGSVHANLFITSRPMKQLENRFSSARHFEVRAREDDINLLIAQKIADDPRFFDLVEEYGIKDEVSSSIREKSGGMFLHAALQIEALSQSLNLKELRRNMDKLPANVRQLYIATLRRIEKLPVKQVKLVKTALIWLVYAHDALTIDDLRYALAFDTDSSFDTESLISENRLLPLFFGLITVEKESRIVRLIHYTAQEVLKPLLEEEFPKPHALLARTCMARLVSCNFHRSTLKTDQDVEEAFDLHPLLEYAYDEWADHARKSLEVPDLREAVFDFVFNCESFPLYCTTDVVDSDEETPIDILSPVHVAAEHNFEEVLADLTRGPHVADINARTTDGMMALMLACVADHPAIVRFLLAHPDIQVNATDHMGYSGLIYAAELGQDTIVDLLLAAPDIDVNLVEGTHGSSALMCAADAGAERLVQRLLRVPDIRADLVDSDGTSALMYAASAGHAAILRHLLGAPGVDVNGEDCEGDTALLCAVAEGRKAAVKMLLAVPDIDVNHANGHGETALIIASTLDDDDDDDCAILRLLLAAPGIQVNAAASQESGLTPLMNASAAGCVRAVGLLLDAKGIDVDAQDRSGRTAAMYAAGEGHCEVLRSLLGAPSSISVNAVDQKGWTALMWACGGGGGGSGGNSESSESVVEVLLESPLCDVNVRNAAGRTALMIAVLNSDEGPAGVVGRLLAAPGVLVNVVDNGGESALIHASKLGRDAAVRRLLAQRDVDAGLQNVLGETALDKAVDRGHHAIARLLREHG